MDSLKRRVTFNADIGFEKLRSDKEEEAENASDKKDKSLIKRPSILRNSNRTSGEKDK